MKTIGGEELPLLSPNQVSMVIAETSKGYVLAVDGTRKSRGKNQDWIYIFDSLDEAEQFARKKLQEADYYIECIIYDHERKFLKEISLRAGA